MAIDWNIERVIDPSVRIDHQEAVREIKEEKRHQGEMFRAALYTYRICYVTNTIGRRTDQLSQQDYADQLGYSPGYITALKRLGRALAFHRVPPESSLYSTLLNNAGRKEFGRLLEATRPMPYDELARAVAEIQARAENNGRPGDSERDWESDLKQAATSIRTSLDSLGSERLQHLEDELGDLYFEVRAVRRRSAQT